MERTDGGSASDAWGYRPRLVVRMAPSAVGEHVSFMRAGIAAPLDLPLIPYVPSARPASARGAEGRWHGDATERLSRYYTLPRETTTALGLNPLILEQDTRIEIAYWEPGPCEPPSAQAATSEGQQQRYHEPADLGLDSRWVWEKTRGAGVGFVDLEQGWTLNHEDLLEADIQLISGDNLYYFGHGTAVLGQVCAAHNGIGCLGMAPECTAQVVSEFRNGSEDHNVADAIASATAAMLRGDVLLIEAQAHYEPFFKVPVEAHEAAFDAIKAATLAGIIVVETAGNGTCDLDLFKDRQGRFPFNRRHRSFRDSGAILVGAALPGVPHERWELSNYGSRIDCFAWGEGVSTCGDGWSGNSVDAYTQTFRGTSAAAPMVAAAAILLQSWSKQHRGQTLTPARMRELLRDQVNNTASANPASDRIGVMPNLRRLFEFM